MSSMAELVGRYVENRRGRGYKIDTESKTLARFAAWCDSERPGEPLSAGLALSWLSTFPDAGDWYRARLYETVRTFSRFACVADPAATLLPRGRTGCHGHRRSLVLEDGEVAELMGALASLSSPDGLRARSASAMCGLMRACGLRPSECARLTVGDWDPKAAAIDVVGSKFGRSRRLPVTDGTAAAIESHLSSVPASDPSAPMLPTTGGRPFDINRIDYAWKVARRGLSDRLRGCVPYTLRHTFASKTIERWRAEGADVDAMMPLLSAYMGHKKVADTYWYLTATGALLDDASEAFRLHSLGGRSR